MWRAALYTLLSSREKPHEIKSTAVVRADQASLRATSIECLELRVINNDLASLLARGRSRTFAPNDRIHDACHGRQYHYDRSNATDCHHGPHPRWCRALWLSVVLGVVGIEHVHRPVLEELAVVPARLELGAHFVTSIAALRLEDVALPHVAGARDRLHELEEQSGVLARA